ncbi:MAG: hypothetical protein N3E37_03930 [Candidatus Micrarchaeota archaeon]|nr:hypothetical protein [Candidatus Micrarchaeota archaeon]
MKLKAQGAFEYMISYGWAILIVIVLGILLFSLGVLNPSQTPSANGFTILRPVSWSFTGGNSHQSNVTVALENVAGQSLVLYVNDTNKGSIKFKKGSSLPCYFNGTSGITVTDSSGNTVPVTSNKVSVPVGGIITISGLIDGNGNGTADSNCGGLINAGYRYDVQLVVEDEYQIIKKDNGLITGKFV